MIFYLFFTLICSISASNNFLPSVSGNNSIPRDVFQKHILPYLYQLPKYSVLLSHHTEDEYYLVDTKWFQLWAQYRPSLSDLLYHYNIMHHQQLGVCEYQNQTDQDILCKNMIKNPFNLKMIFYLKECDETAYNLIAYFRDRLNAFGRDITPRSTDRTNVLCNEIIDKKRIYYWEGFSLLLYREYHAIWVQCFKRALETGYEDKRDLRFIADRYEYDLQFYVSFGKKFDFFDAVEHEKKKYNIQNNENEINDLCFISRKELCIYQIEKNKNLVVKFLNNFPLIIEIFGSYWKFRNEKSVQEFYQENQDFISKFFYTQFKKMYDSGKVSLTSMDQGEFSNGKSLNFLIDFLIHTRSVVLQIIANQALSDEQVCFLFTYGMLAFENETAFNALNLNYSQIIDLIKDFPPSFNRRCEDSFYSNNSSFERVICLQRKLGFFRSEQRQKSPEKLSEKLLSAKKFIKYKKKKFFILGLTVGLAYFIFKYIENVFARRLFPMALALNSAFIIRDLLKFYFVRFAH